ncbi:1,5-anhydro-D-fructose reductase [Anabrus simplex]|uniref:1,5-anhydro-D-fructose reductase n=1 Tax=Anabrus simplex TaxID=316456 RepID=UPI0034DD747D
MEMPTTPSIKFNNGYLCPVLGLGTYQAKETRQAVKYAVDAGYRHFDGAAVYENEAEVGAGIRDKIEEGVIKREDVFITSKLWCTCLRPDLVVPALKDSLARFCLDYLDLYLVHWPFSMKEGTGTWIPRQEDGSVAQSTADYLDTWKQMEECVKLGLTRSIGVSNFNNNQLQRLLDVCTIKPVTNQVECHPFLNQKELIAFCRARDVVVTAYSPLANPSKQDAVGAPRLLDDPKLKSLAEKHNKTVAQVILRYLIQIGTLAIPKSANKSRIEENIQVFDFSLSDDEMAFMDSLDNNTRTCPFSEMKSHPNYPF